MDAANSSLPPLVTPPPPPPPQTATVPAKLCKRENTKQFHDSKIKFPLVQKFLRPSSKSHRTVFKVGGLSSAAPLMYRLWVDCLWGVAMPHRCAGVLPGTLGLAHRPPLAGPFLP